MSDSPKPLHPEKAKPGRDRRGNRKPTMLRIPEDIHELYAEMAKDLGIPIGSVMVRKLAEAAGKPVPDYILTEIRTAELRRAQEEWPLAG